MNNRNTTRCTREGRIVVHVGSFALCVCTDPILQGRIQMRTLLQSRVQSRRSIRGFHVSYVSVYRCTHTETTVIAAEILLRFPFKMKNGVNAHSTVSSRPSSSATYPFLTATFRPTVIIHTQPQHFTMR